MKATPIASGFRRSCGGCGAHLVEYHRHQFRKLLARPLQNAGGKRVALLGAACDHRSQRGKIRRLAPSQTSAGWPAQPAPRPSPAPSAARSRAAGNWSRPAARDRTLRSRPAPAAPPESPPARSSSPSPRRPAPAPSRPRRKLSPLADRPIAFDPVPAITSIPGPPANAASSAISSSPHRISSPATTAVTARRAHACTAGLLTPASPKHVRSTCPSETPAAAAASASIACSRAVASGSETRISFTVPVVARASTRSRRQSGTASWSRPHRSQQSSPSQQSYRHASRDTLRTAFHPAPHQKRLTVQRSSSGRATAKPNTRHEVTILRQCLCGCIRSISA